MQWVVFEPNDERLWPRARSTITSFMAKLFRAGGYPAPMSDEAYFVKCGRETMMRTDINLGVIKIGVGFAPVRPAEFVVIRIRQVVGQIEN